MSLLKTVFLVVVGPGSNHNSNMLSEPSTTGIYVAVELVIYPSLPLKLEVARCGSHLSAARGSTHVL